MDRACARQISGTPPDRSAEPSYPPGYFTYGPSWLGSGGSPEDFAALFGPSRPESIEHAITSVNVSAIGNGIGVGARLWADGPVVPGHHYELRYQIRLHTRKGEAGPLLGTSERPNGIAFRLESQVCDDDWNGLEGHVDITRKEVSGMGNLPEVQHGTQSIFLKVEPQLIDTTANTFLTDTQTNALILHAEVGPSRKIVAINPLSVWVSVTSRRDPQSVVKVLNDLDSYREKESGVGFAIGNLLNGSELSEDKKALLIDGLPINHCGDRLAPYYHVFDVLVKLSESENGSLREAARKKVEAVRQHNNPISAKKD